MADSLLDNYNPLYDIHLRQYFALPHMQKHLQKMGLLESTLNLNGEEVYARHHAMMDMMLKNREAQLMRMAELRKKLDAAEKVEICRRIRSGQSPESYRRGKPSRSLSRSRAAQKGGRQRRFSNSFEDKDFVQHVEDDNAEPLEYNTNDPYKRLSANAKRFNYLHKLDDPTLIAYKDNLKKQLQRLERFREISFGPHSVARQPAPPQTSWFFRRRSLPSLTASAPGNTLKEPLRSILSMRGRKATPHTGGNKLNASHDSRTSCPPTTRKRRDSNPRLPPINGQKMKVSKPPVPASSAVARLPPTGKKQSPSRGRPSTKRLTTTTTVTTKTSTSSEKTVLPSVTGQGIFGGAAAVAAAAGVAVAVDNIVSNKTEIPSPIPIEETQNSPTPPHSPALESQRTFDRSSPIEDLAQYEQPESPTLQNRKATPAASPTLLEDHHEHEDFGAHANDAYSNHSDEQEDRKSNASEKTGKHSDAGENVIIPSNESSPESDHHHDSASDSDSEPEYAEEDKEVEETFAKQEVHEQHNQPDQTPAEAILETEDHHEDHQKNDNGFEAQQEVRGIPELKVDHYQSIESTPRVPPVEHETAQEDEHQHVILKRSVFDDHHDENNAENKHEGEHEAEHPHLDADSHPTSPAEELKLEINEHVQNQEVLQSPAQSVRSQPESVKEEQIEKSPSPAPSNKSHPAEDLPSPAQSERSQPPSIHSSHHESEFTPTSPMQSERSLAHQIAGNLVDQVMDEQNLASPVLSERSHTEQVQHVPDLPSPVQSQHSHREATDLPSPVPSQHSHREETDLPSPAQSQHSNREVADLPSPVPSQHSHRETTDLPSPVQSQHSNREVADLPSPVPSQHSHREATDLPSPAQSQHSHKEMFELSSPVQSESSKHEHESVQQDDQQHVEVARPELVEHRQSPTQQEYIEQISVPRDLPSPTPSDYSEESHKSGGNVAPVVASDNLPSPAQSDRSQQNEHVEEHFERKIVTETQAELPSPVQSDRGQHADNAEEHFERRIVTETNAELPSPAQSDRSQHNEHVEENFEKTVVQESSHELPSPVQSERSHKADSLHEYAEQIEVPQRTVSPTPSEKSQQMQAHDNHLVNSDHLGSQQLDNIHTDFNEHNHQELASPAPSERSQKSLSANVELEIGGENTIHQSEVFQNVINQEADSEASALIEEALHEVPAIIDIAHTYTEDYVTDKHSPRPVQLESPVAEQHQEEQEHQQEDHQEQHHEEHHLPEPEAYELKYDQDGVHQEELGHNVGTNDAMTTSIYQASNEDHKSNHSDGEQEHRNGDTETSYLLEEHHISQQHSDDNVSTDSLIIHEEPADYQMNQSVYQPRDEPSEHVEEKEWDEGNSHVHEVTKNSEFTDKDGTRYTETTTTTVTKSGNIGEDDFANNNDDDEDKKSSNGHVLEEQRGENGNLIRETITTTTHTVTSSGLPTSGILVDDEDEGNVSSL